MERLDEEPDLEGGRGPFSVLSPPSVRTLGDPLSSYVTITTYYVYYQVLFINKTRYKASMYIDINTMSVFFFLWKYRNCACFLCIYIRDIH